MLSLPQMAPGTCQTRFPRQPRRRSPILPSTMAYRMSCLPSSSRTASPLANCAPSTPLSHTTATRFASSSSSPVPLDYRVNAIWVTVVWQMCHGHAGADVIRKYHIFSAVTASWTRTVACCTRKVVLGPLDHHPAVPDIFTQTSDMGCARCDVECQSVSLHRSADAHQSALGPTATRTCCFVLGRP